MSSKQHRVPRGTDNPIDYLLHRGWTLPKLASAWDLKTTDNLRKLRGFKHVPKYRTAELMAVTFGWGSAGEVMDFYAARVATRKVAS